MIVSLSNKPLAFSAKQLAGLVACSPLSWLFRDMSRVLAFSGAELLEVKNFSPYVVSGEAARCLLNPFDLRLRF